MHSEVRAARYLLTTQYDHSLSMAENEGLRPGVDGHLVYRVERRYRGARDRLSIPVTNYTLSLKEW